MAIEVFFKSTCTPSGETALVLATDRVHQGDCLRLLAQLARGSVDLAFADPPFNIGYEYDLYDDRKPYEAYLDWSRQWIVGIRRVLKPTGTFWLAIGDEYAAELKLIAQNDARFHCRSWVVWYYTFGVNCTKKFSRSHAHLFQFVCDPSTFTFNTTDPSIRVPSARQLVYADTRANPNGRLPDDTWILRPQDVPNGFPPDQDTVYFPRVAGTFKERAGFHGCQMPEQLLGRIMRVSSNPGDLVLDPFSGSGTTLAVAKKLGRSWIGFELSKDYARQANARIEGAKVNDELNGPADPLSSAPSTSKGRPLGGGIVGKKKSSWVSGNSQESSTVRVPAVLTKIEAPASKRPFSEIERAIAAAYWHAARGLPSDWLLIDPAVNELFLSACRAAGIRGNEVDWNRLLLRLRKSGRLPRIGHLKLPRFSAKLHDPYCFASEIAWHVVAKQHNGRSLDDIFCDPNTAGEFDKVAARYAPGFQPYQYRSAAFWMRKRAKMLNNKADKLEKRGVEAFEPDWTPWHKAKSRLPVSCPGVYMLAAARSPVWYVGETINLAGRLAYHGQNAQEWNRVAWFTPDGDRSAIQALLVRKWRPIHSAILKAR